MAGHGIDAREVRRLDRQARERLAGRLEALRRERDYTLNFLADAAQVGRGHLSSVFAAKTNVTLGTLVKLAYALDVDVSQLLAGGPVSAPRLVRGRPRSRRITDR